MKLAASQQGLAYAPLGKPGDSFGWKDVETTATAVFNVADTMAVQACGKQYSLAASGQTQMTAIPSASTITTDQMRVMPTVEWKCQTNRLYSLVLYDAFAHPVTTTSGGHLHWIKINIPCNAGTSKATSTDGVTFGDVEYFSPANPHIAPHNYGIYILEQRDTAAIAPTQDELARFDRTTINTGLSLRQFVEWSSDKGPIARTWAWSTISAWSPYALEQAGKTEAKNAACENLKLTATAEVVAFWPPGGVEYRWGTGRYSQAAFETAGNFIKANNDIAGVKVYTPPSSSPSATTVFLTVPRWFHGVPSTLNKINIQMSDQRLHVANNPPLTPFPSWEMNMLGNCSALQYIQSMEVDLEGHMWVIDVGTVDLFDPRGSDTRCPPKIVIIHAETGALVDEPYIFPDEVTPWRLQLHSHLYWHDYHHPRPDYYPVTLSLTHPPTH